MKPDLPSSPGLLSWQNYRKLDPRICSNDTYLQSRVSGSAAAPKAPAAHLPGTVPWLAIARLKGKSVSSRTKMLVSRKCRMTISEAGDMKHYTLAIMGDYVPLFCSALSLHPKPCPCMALPKGRQLIRDANLNLRVSTPQNLVLSVVNS